MRFSVNLYIVPFFISNLVPKIRDQSQKYVLYRHI